MHFPILALLIGAIGGLSGWHGAGMEGKREITIDEFYFSGINISLLDLRKRFLPKFQAEGALEIAELNHGNWRGGIA